MKITITFEPKRSILPDQIHKTEEIAWEANLQSDDYATIDLIGVAVDHSPELHGVGMCGVTVQKDNAEPENFFISIEPNGHVAPWNE